MCYDAILEELYVNLKIDLQFDRKISLLELAFFVF